MTCDLFRERITLLVIGAGKLSFSESERVEHKAGNEENKNYRNRGSASNEVLSE